MQKLMAAWKKIHNPRVMSDFVRTFFLIFLVVELTKLGGLNLYLGLNSIYFCHQRSNLTFKRGFLEFFHVKKGTNWVKNEIFQHSSTRSIDWCINCDVLKRKIIFIFLPIDYKLNFRNLFFSSKHHNLRTNRKNLASWVELFHFWFNSDILSREKILKTII